MEYASAAAPSAAIVVASCEGTDTIDPELTALQNVTNGPNPPVIISDSYGECEAENGAADTAAYAAIYQQGITEGISNFVAGGDQDASSCDGDGGGTPVTTIHGIGVDAQASTPYNVATGGTDFSDTFSGTNSTYWNNTNSTNLGSALSYIPEIPWNSTCASQLIATSHGFATTYGSSGFCNSTAAAHLFGGLSNTGGSGGPSGCATGSPSIHGVVSGTCQGWPKPTWQSGFLGNPADGVRDIPDVSLFAANGAWNYVYIYCYSDTRPGGVNEGSAPCTGSVANWSESGGTSFTAPIFAGIQALVNQYTGSAQGLPNYAYYRIAATAYGASGNSNCNSSNGNAIAASCVFYDVTLGDDNAPCKADSGTFYNCYDPAGTYGVISTDNNSYQPAYTTHIGWDFPTGIGTVNVTNLVQNWRCTYLVATHDFNGDCMSDVFWRDTSGNVGMWLMNGSSISATSVLGNVPGQWSVVGQRDFNGDGNGDVLWRDTGGNVGMWLMNGKTIQSSAVLGNVPNTWSVAATGDFNSDGMGDILWRDTSGNVGMWLMNGTSILQTAVIGNVPTNWVVAGADTHGDIFWRNSTTGEVGMWVMKGTTIAGTVDFGPVPQDWSIAGIGDFDGNGSEDILWRDTSGNVGVWLLNGASIQSTTVLGNVPLTWTVAETGDYNGDGRTDILWIDNTGNAGVWFMNGTAASSTTTYGYVGTNWVVQAMSAE